MAEVEVLAIHHTSQWGNVVAFIDIQIGPEIVVNAIRLVKRTDGLLYVSLPQKPVLGTDGRKSYLPVVELTGRTWQAVRVAILEAWGHAQSVPCSPLAPMNHQEQ